MTVFDEATGTPKEETQTSELADLVGEGKKFATVEDLAKGKQESDRFIEQLQGELSGLREDLGKRMTSEQVLEEINRQKVAEKEAAESRNEEPTSPQTSEKTSLTS